MSIREKALAYKELPRKELYIPEWDCTVYIRTLGQRERTRWEQITTNNKGRRTDDILAQFVVLCVCEEDGRPAFTAADIPELLESSSVPFQRIWEVAGPMNRFTVQDAEELAKN